MAQSDTPATETNQSEQAPSKGKLLTADEAADWGNETTLDLGEPKKEGEKTEPTPEPVEEPKDAPRPDPKPHELPQLPDDPGEFTPQDRSFEVTVFDEEGKNPKVRKIASVDDWEALLETEPNLGSTLQAERAMRKASKMESGLEQDKKDYDDTKKTYDTALEAEQARVDTMNSWSAEVAYLESKGLLPPVAKELQDSDWTTPENSKQPGIKERSELMDYMYSENDSRVKAGLKPMTSLLDAFNAMQNDKGRQQAETDRKRQGEERKAAGSRVASSSAAPVSGAPKGISVGRGGSLRDLGMADQWGS